MPMTNVRSFPVAGRVTPLILALLGAACGEKLDAVQPTGDRGPCPTAITYEKDTRAIFDQYCTRCHAATKTGAERNGAPAAANFDTYQGVLARADTASAYVQSDFMPFGGPALPTAQKTLLQCWITQGKNEK